MERCFSTGQNPQRAVAPKEEEEDIILALLLSGGLELSAATPGLFCRCFESDTNITFVCVCVYLLDISKLCLCARFGECLKEWDCRSVVY